ncbi:MAG: hypothetical protein QHH12_07530 [Candidatus Bathyarchaeota archaeon]|nr:hypothetical protein [Candidatus Bathyarchaeota archaeon A05DMB-3]MDH7607589.1 hypothetical protein [Candidatus Bathyarchaeota archaeon]
MKVKIPRNVRITTHSFTKFFKGFEKVEAVKSIFGEKTEEVLNNLQVEFAGFRGYMGVSDIDGHIIISARYLNNGDLIDIYLDIIHELVHVKQFMEGKKLFDDRYSYVGRPTEIEAYRHAVAEAKRLGLDDSRICQYLKTEWMNEKDLKKLTKILGVKYVPLEKRCV